MIALVTLALVAAFTLGLAVGVRLSRRSQRAQTMDLTGIKFRP